MILLQFIQCGQTSILRFFGESEQIQIFDNTKFTDCLLRVNDHILVNRNITDSLFPLLQGNITKGTHWSDLVQLIISRNVRSPRHRPYWQLLTLPLVNKNYFLRFWIFLAVFLQNFIIMVKFLILLFQLLVLLLL